MAAKGGDVKASRGVVKLTDLPLQVDSQPCFHLLCSCPLSQSNHKDTRKRMLSEGVPKLPRKMLKCH